MKTFRDYQLNIKFRVESGKISKKEGMILILTRAQEILEELKMPEDQSWEIQEYGAMAKTIN